MGKISNSSFVKEFKTFITRGSVLDLAVGVVIGGAFSQIVNSLVQDIIMPVVGILLGGVDFSSLSIDIPNFMGGSGAAHITYGNFIQNVVDFLVVAFALFLFIRAINRMNERAARLAKAAQAKLDKQAAAEEQAEAAAEQKSEDEQTALLKEIRDALVKKKK